MDGFTGFESAAGEELPKAWAVIDPFHVVSLAFSKLDQCRPHPTSDPVLAGPGG